MMAYLIAFVVGGLICLVGQIFLDLTRLTPAHLMSVLVSIGALLDAFGLYDKLIDFAGAGATVPITNFGHALLHGALAEAETHGWIGIGMGMFKLTSAGISAAIIFAFFAALIFKPKG